MDSGVAIPFADHLGFQIESAQDGQSVLRYQSKPEHLNGFAVTHGGVCMTLLDVAMSAAGRSLANGMGMVTIEMKTSFMRPTPGGKLVCKGSVMHRTATLAFTQASIYDEQGVVTAHATGTFKYLRALP